MERIRIITQCFEDAKQRFFMRNDNLYENEKARSDYQYRYDKWKDTTSLHLFRQIYSSTTGAFGGIGGQAFTYYWTCVLVNKENNNVAFVYCNNGRFAYSCKINKEFLEYLSKENMPEHYVLDRKGTKLEIIEKEKRK